jgi:hypothetical protein
LLWRASASIFMAAPGIANASDDPEFKMRATEGKGIFFKK